jgi:tetratricopeptide (TPR) repeat protein
VFVAHISMQLADGYHVYSLSQAVGGPTAMVISVPANQPFQLAGPIVGPEPEKVFDPNFGMETEHHVGAANFAVPIQVTSDAPAGQHSLVLEVLYQLCNEHICTAPRRKSLRAIIKVAAASASARSTAMQQTGAMTSAFESESMQELQSTSATSESRLRRALAEYTHDGALEAEIKRILADDPSFAVAYLSLARIKSKRGEKRAERQFLKKAISADPGNAMFQLNYANTYKSSSQTKHRLLGEVAARFPNSDGAAGALRDAAADASNDGDRIACLERAFGQGSLLFDLHILRDLCPLLAPTDPDKAVRFIERAYDAAQKVPWVTEPLLNDLQAYKAFYHEVANIRRLMAQGKVTEAATTVEKLQLHGNELPGNGEGDIVVYTVLKAEVLAAQGNVLQAYESIASHPAAVVERELVAAATRLGAQLGRSRRQVQRELWKAFWHRDYPVADFEFDNLVGGRVEADDFRGQVLLVNVWNPG